MEKHGQPTPLTVSKVQTTLVKNIWQSNRSSEVDEQIVRTGTSRASCPGAGPACIHSKTFTMRT